MSSLPSSPPPFTCRKRRRSRSRRFSSALPSSDPVFSSDDLQDASLEQYDAPRKHKKKYKGAWWQPGSTQEGPGNSKRAKPRGQFGRKMDSGVWMGSDDVLTDEYDQELGFQNTTPKAELGGGHLAYRARPFASPVKSKQLGHDPDCPILDLAQKIVDKAVEDCCERVDLSHIGLTRLSDATLRPLRTLTRKPRAMYSPPVDDAFEDFRPHIQLYLSQNALGSLPLETWSLSNLTVLSIRHNELTELPAGIARLENLAELNIAVNKLRWLPYELLSLTGKSLRQLALRPNPNLLEGLPTGTRAVQKLFEVPQNRSQLPRFYSSLVAKITELKTFIQDEVVTSSDRERARWILQWLRTLRRRMEASGQAESRESPQKLNFTPVFIASTPVSYLGIDGLPVSDIQRPSDLPEETTYLQAFPPSPQDSVPNVRQHVPSLLELSIRSAASHIRAKDMLPLLPDSLPLPLSTVLSYAESAEADNTDLVSCRTCSVCSRAYIIPRAEWVEFWHWGPEAFGINEDQAKLSHAFVMDQLFFPCLRRACSYDCVNAVVLERAEEAAAALQAES